VQGSLKKSVKQILSELDDELDLATPSRPSIAAPKIRKTMTSAIVSDAEEEVEAAPRKARSSKDLKVLTQL
jgi:hypothetical protein